jgi:hypothetical protein
LFCCRAGNVTASPAETEQKASGVAENLHLRRFAMDSTVFVKTVSPRKEGFREREAMSTLADRGGHAEVAASAKLDRESAASWSERREATIAENAKRRERRDACLRDSALTGAAAGIAGGYGAYRATMSLSAARRAFMGSGGQAFGVIVGFFMPFTFVSNVVRWRCQKQGLTPFKPPVVASVDLDA